MSAMKHEHYAELVGKLNFVGAGPEMKDKVVFSDITVGGHVGTRAPGLGLKYVARGTEYYSVGGRTFAVGEGEFMCMPQEVYSEVEVRRTGDSTLGLCIFVRSDGPYAPVTGDEGNLDEPIVFPANCTSLGRLLEGTMKGLVKPEADRPRSASLLLGHLRTHLEPLLEETSRGLDSLEGTKASTRYESLRRLNRARGYLHSVVDRRVDLPELASVAGMSRFQLLRYFRDCYGTPPATYHRRLRLEQAKAEMDRHGLTCSEAAFRYGFSDASSFSHAFRRTFGRPPRQN